MRQHPARYPETSRHHDSGPDRGVSSAGPASTGSDRLRDFVVKGGLTLWYFEDRAVVRAFELMERYADQSMDLADASLVVAAERLGTRKVFTIDRRDFTVYRVKRGHRQYAFEVLGGKTS
jgi:uncharacterized protein